MEEEVMKTVIGNREGLAALAVGLLIGFAPLSAFGKDIDVCKAASKSELRQLYRKPLYAKAYGEHCLWSERPGGMAEFDIAVGDNFQPLRKNFDDPLPKRFKLVKITDLGSEGLMTVGEGTIGVVAIRRGDRLLKSAVTFLDIKPGSSKQKVLWNIYRRILKQM
jgi:hypothetical protein